ncbi:MAG TPA: ABC transporter ATP-binding protein [Alphaproteobacteria bacterium]|nr:ABC transporter ATP-binding protein [Alphaproteobacteria bacterium]
MAEALALAGVSAGYGPTHVLEDVTLGVGASQSLSIVGRNGVGKSTLLNTIMGHTTLHGGTIRLGDRDITRLAVHKRATAGIGYVPQEREIFPSLTVMENLTIGETPGPWTEAAVFDLFPNLAERRDNMGNQLSGGEQQMLSIARALMTNPSVLLMDEPSEGLAPIIVEELVRILGRLRESGGITLILVEQNTRIAFEFSDRTVVLDRGRITFDGESQTLKSDKDLLDKLIGVGA